MSKGRILIVDDEAILTESLHRVLVNTGYEVVICTQSEEFFQYLSSFNPDLILMDIYLVDDDGIRLFGQMREEGWETPVIIMTGHSDVSLAVRAMKQGAADFLLKPFEISHLLVLLEKTLDYACTRKKVKLLQRELEEQRSRHGIIGNSFALRRVLETTEKLALGENTTVLLVGESGTGKELVARFLHQKSPRAEKSFITLNCGAIPKDLAESEFFGYEKGAFTGATEKMKLGKFELANGGTILLDEIGELSLEMQVKLLRILEEKRFYRLGGTREILIDVRVIAATNKDLLKEVELGRFREDLFYRLNVAVIHIPPLRARREDIRPITHAFLEEFCKKFNKPVPQLSKEVLDLFEQLSWRGNVRELRNAIERAVLLSDSPTLITNHFNFLRSGENGASKHPSGSGKRFSLEIPPSGVEMKEVLRELILKTLSITHGNQVRAAKILRITRSKLRYRMEQLGIHPERRAYKILS